MREHKYRAWHKGEGRMVEVMCIDWHYSRIEFARNEADKEWATLPSASLEKVILIQFTGLLDKNGVEIYEGDLFWWNWHDSPILRIVEFQYGAFIGRDVGHIIPMQHLFNFPLSQIEVIGNQWENPELLA